ARSSQQSALWQEAAALWEEILNDPKQTPREPQRIRYELGVCYRHLGRLDDAARLWEQVMLHTGEDGQAAAWGLAELRLTGNQPAAALECFERAVQGVAVPSAYHNTAVDVKEAVRTFELGCEVYRTTGDAESFRRLAHLYQKLAAPGKEQELLAQAADAWAQ